jgi:hypothetical protein
MTGTPALPSRPAGAFLGQSRNGIRQNAYCVCKRTLAPARSVAEPALRCVRNPLTAAAFLPLARGSYPRLASAPIDSRGDNHAAETTATRTRRGTAGAR